MSLGSLKEKYVYTDDSGKSFIVTLASDDVFSNSGLSIYNPTSPPAGGTNGRISPKRCRAVYAQGIVTVDTTSRTVRKRFVCGVTSSLYESNTPQQIAYLGTTNNLTTTGRRGEKITF